MEHSCSRIDEKLCFFCFKKPVNYGNFNRNSSPHNDFCWKSWKKIGTKAIGFISAGLFVLGYLISSFSKGNFYLIFLGNGIMAGISTGFGYHVSLFLSNSKTTES